MGIVVNLSLVPIIIYMLIPFGFATSSALANASQACSACIADTTKKLCTNQTT